jgi:hypothetical protein
MWYWSGSSLPVEGGPETIVGSIFVLYPSDPKWPLTHDTTMDTTNRIPPRNKEPFVFAKFVVNDE